MCFSVTFYVEYSLHSQVKQLVFIDSVSTFLNMFLSPGNIVINQDICHSDFDLYLSTQRPVRLRGREEGTGNF